MRLPPIEVRTLKREATTRMFMSNRGHAVKLPKSVALPKGVKNVVIVATGNRRLITPAGESWNDLFDHAGHFGGFHERTRAAQETRLGVPGMVKYLLDTNFLVYTVKNRPKRVPEQFKHHEGQMCTSAVTWGELVYDCERLSRPEQNLADIEAMAARLEVSTFGRDAAVHFGQVQQAR